MKARFLDSRDWQWIALNEVYGVYVAGVGGEGGKGLGESLQRLHLSCDESEVGTSERKYRVDRRWTDLWQLALKHLL